MHAAKTESWIHARAFQQRNPTHKGRYGIYRATVTRPRSPQETRLGALRSRVAIALGARTLPRYAHA